MKHTTSNHSPVDKGYRQIYVIGRRVASLQQDVLYYFKPKEAYNHCR